MQERMALGFDCLEGALDRAREMEFDERFAPLAEALMWLVIVNDAFWEENEAVYRRHRESGGAGRSIEGLRYARHRLVHDIRVYGMHGALNGAVWGESKWGEAVWGDQPSWNWRNLDTLDPAIDRTGEDAYREHLEGRPVLPTLEDAFEYLNSYRAVWAPATAAEEDLNQ